MADFGSTLSPENCRNIVIKNLISFQWPGSLLILRLSATYI